MTTSNGSLTVEPYVFFDGCCEEALEFYKRALDLKVDMMMRYKDSPCPVPNVNGEKIMHATVRIGNSVWMASDGHCTGAAKFEGFGLSINLDDEAKARKIFATLLEGGQARMPLEKTFFSPLFGMVADKFGVLWMVHVKGAS